MAPTYKERYDEDGYNGYFTVKAKEYSADTYDKYAQKVAGIDCHSLYFVRPASNSTSTDKSVFRLSNVSKAVYNLTPLDNARQAFEVDYNYVKRKLLKFDPQSIMAFNLGGIFTKSTKVRFGLVKSSTTADFYKTHVVERTRYQELIRQETKNKVSVAVKAADKTTKKLNEKVSNQKDQKMNKLKSTASTVKDVNVDAVKLTAKIAAGKALNTMVQEKIVPKLPIMVRGYGQTDLGKILLANVAASALTYYAPNDERARMVSEAMIQAAMLDLMASFDIEGMVKEFMNSDAAKRIADASEG